MKSKKTSIKVPGSVDATPKYQSLHNYFSGIEIKSFTTGVARGAGEASPVVDLEQDDVVMTEFENGIRWVHSSSDFVSKLKLQQPFARGASDTDEITVPLQWQEDNAPSRGLISSGLKLLGINVVKNVAGKAIAKDIAKRVEQNNPNILYNCDENFNFAGAFDKTKAVQAPYLLLIHGTGSNTKGGFGGLSTGIKNIYQSLYEQYGKRVIAYEHKTFSQSPVQNIIELVSQLPDSVTVDIISHSRGGLLGEILARISSNGWKGVFTKEEMDLLNKNKDENKTLLAEINTLNEKIQNKQIKVNRFVRVACPAAGTTLVSDRADKLLNVLCNVLSAIPGEVISTLIDGLTALLTAVVNEKNNTETLPGIECMKPDSSFIKALNYYETKIDSELIVITGDSVGEGFFNKIKMFLIDSFYKEDNDLVVNTISMKKGTGRTRQFLIYDEQAGNVNHFHYFINDSSQKIIMQSLAGNASETRGFYGSDVLQRAVVPDVINASNRSGATIPKDMPVLYVLPDIMGSNLQADNKPIWLKYNQVMEGGLARLKITAIDNVKTDGINGKAYRKLTDYFTGSYYVIPFAYDWRKSVFEAADELEKSIRKTVAETDSSVSFIAHSMGGLVLRAFAVKHKLLWEQLTKKSNCRVLMMGTPNEGSYATLRLLLGNDKTINALAALDLTSNKKGLLAQFAQYPGLLQMLPAKNGYDFGEVSQWNDLMGKAGVSYSVPDAAVLAEYLRMREPDFSGFVYDPAIVTYIAGRGDQTPMGIRYDEDNNKIDFLATPLGDGIVTWSTIPAELLDNATYYVNAEHGNIANHEPSFAGYKELLANGKTDKLSRKQPVTRGESNTELMPEQDRVTVADENALVDYVMGVEATDIKGPKQQVEISITHGDLGHAVYPIVAGHFKGDGILQAEKIINQKLDNYLSIRHAMNNYPGEIGTHEVIFLSPRKRAMIIGLGEFGGLTENRLSQTLRQALMTYIVKSKSLQAVDDTSTGFLGISYLLIGTGFGGLTIYSCIKALLNAVKEANAFFENGNYSQYDLINKVEIVELYQYKAIQAGRIIRSILSNNQFTGISFIPDNIKRASGAKTEIPDEMQTDWWQRLKVSMQDNSDSKDNKDCNGKTFSRVITFSSITDKARNEETVLNTNISLVDNLIKRAAAVTNNNKQLCQTLYEMLVPNEFKGYGSDLRNIVLLVDKETARYPWEMMMDAYADSKDPLVTKTGFLRQLATSTYRERVEISFEDNALVVGNPTLNNYYPNLPGAGKEAESVAELLTGSSYTVNKYINQESLDVLTDLYSKQYKIIHIAAHGVLKDKVTCQTGIVLGEQLILTPSDFKQLRKVPELVFINCCSLGTINKEDEERLQRKFQVAAGIGTELIEIGVKAVIVAGWEVNDDAAVTFSYTFYTHLLSGKNFGDAVKEARETTYKAYPQYNTWGAYQCYGDPLYRLRVIESSNTPGDIFFCDPIEAVNKLQTLASLAESASTRDAKDAIDNDIKRVTKAIDLHPEWKFDAGIAEQMAELYKRLGMVDKAVELYERLFLMEDAQYTVRTIEQYCNVKVKQATKKCKDALKKGKPTDKTKAINEATTVIQSMILRLENLNVSPTSERYNLIGSAYRRLAEINESNEAKYIENLAKSADSYYKGYSLFYTSYSKVDYYPLYNWLITASILTELKNTTPKLKPYAEMLIIPDNLEALMQEASLYAAEQNRKQPDFWNRTADSTRYLLTLIRAEEKDDIGKAKQAILDNHTEAWEIEGSAFKQNAIKEHAEFVISMFNTYRPQLKKTKWITDKIKALESLVSALGS